MMTTQTRQPAFRLSRLSLALLPALCLPAPAMAQSALDTIVISADAPLPLPDEASVSEEETTVPRADLSEVLREIGGITAGRMSGHGLDPIIRGQREHQLAVSLDGAAIANACPNRMDPPTSFGNLTGYDEVVVTRGVTTLTQGAGGSGGRIELERNTFERAARTGIQSRFGFGTSDNGLSDQSSADVLLSNGHAYARAIGSIANGDNYEDGNGDEVPSSYKQRSGAIVGGYRVNEHTGIEVSVDRNRMLDTRYAGAGMDSVYDNATIYRLDGRIGDLDGPVDAVRLELSRANVDHLMDNFSLRDLVAPMPMESLSESHATSARLGLSSSMGALDLEYGVDFERIEQNAAGRSAMNETVMFRQWPDARADQFGGFVEANWSPTDAGRLVAGARVDRFESEIDTALDKSLATHMHPGIPEEVADSARRDKSDTEISALLRYEHRFSKQLAGHVGLSRTAAAPNLTQKYALIVKGGDLDKVGNPDLNPEIHHQLATGLAWRTERFEATGTLYLDQVEDFILQDQTVPTYRNVDARLYGGEADLTYAVTDWLEARGQVAYTRGRNTDDSRNLPQIPPLSGRLGLTAQYAAFSGGVDLRWADRATHLDTDSGLDTRETAGYGVVDLHAGWDITANWRIQAGVENLFDKTYAEHVNRVYTRAFGDPQARINEPGRTLWARLTARF
ncbi:MAG: TonB-dependent receptor domain-containing protein [Pseudomonadota bacterium]